jgi:hypothetical protein
VAHTESRNELHGRLCARSMSVVSRPFPDTGVRAEQPVSRSQPGLCTPVDIRSKKAQKFSLFLTFRLARRDFPKARSDPQLLSYEADRTARVGFPSGRNTEWGADPQNSHIDFRLLFTISGRNSYPKMTEPASVSRSSSTLDENRQSCPLPTRWKRRCPREPWITRNLRRSFRPSPLEDRLGTAAGMIPTDRSGAPRH